jgi:quinol monooxygenase YgiN
MSKNTVYHIGTLHAKPEYTDELIKTFEALNHAPGIISFDCFRDIENKNKLTLVEEWENKEDHENFVKSFSNEEMEQWLNMLSKESEDTYCTKQ